MLQLDDVMVFRVSQSFEFRISTSLTTIVCVCVCVGGGGLACEGDDVYVFMQKREVWQ